MKKKFRYLILLLMVVVAAVCACMIPRININADMTEYLPRDSRMREGLDTMKRVFPLVDMNAPQLRVMVSGPSSADGASLSAAWVDSVGRALESRPGVAALVSTRVKDSLALFEFYGESFDDVVRISGDLRSEGSTGPDGAVVLASETNANSNMPEGMGTLLLAGVALIFVILFVMCASVVEALLFILTIGLAVVMNMGTNALLPSVSMMTNTIVAVLQFVLSMDYSIILMSRYRLEKQLQSAGAESSAVVDSEAAMSRALKRASSSILSSSFTTIVGLLALVFMKFRIGLDLGLVLAKGVFCSLVCIYTVLPGLVLLFEKWIDATSKKVPVFPTDGLAKYEVKYRWALSLAFVMLFAGSLFLQGRTRLSYASIWESEIARFFPARTSFMVLYRTDEDDSVPALLDSVVAAAGNDAGNVEAVSWPSIMRRPFSAGDIVGMISENAPGLLADGDASGLTEDNIRLLYYAWAHPKRTERMSFDDIISLSEEAAKMGIMPEGLDVSSLTDMFAAEPDEPEMPRTDAPAPAPMNAPDSVNVPDSVNAAELQKSGRSVTADGAKKHHRVKSKYSYESCTAQRTSSDLAAFLGFEEGNAKTIYSLAGRRGGTMSVTEFLSYVNDKVLTNKLMRRMISSRQRAGLAMATASADSAILAGPTAVPSLLSAPFVDSIAVTLADSALFAVDPDALWPGRAKRKAAAAVVREQTPMEKLAEMAMSGKKFSAGQIAGALKAAEVPVDAKTVDLMFMYYGFRHERYGAGNPEPKMTLEQMLDFLTDKVVKDPMFSPFIPEGTGERIGQMRGMIDGKLGNLHGTEWSMAAVMTELPVEAPETFEFVENLHRLTDKVLEKPHYVIGEPVMYKEMDDGFGRELLLLTIITVGSIFLIVAITFRSLVIPLILVLSVMTGVFVNVYVSGIGGKTMLYLAYLIVQSILMGATIDYGILLTNCYREIRSAGEGKVRAMMRAYRMSMPTIMTSGMILVFAPYVISLVMTDPSIRSILSCLSVGAASALMVIIFLLPAMLTAADRFVVRGRH